MHISKWMLGAAIVLGSFAATSVWAATATVYEVNCDKGKKIQDAVERVRIGRPNTDYVIKVTGACMEDVAVLNVLADSLVIDGGGTASITGTGALSPVILVWGANHVTIRGFMIAGTQNGVLFHDCQICHVEDSNVVLATEGGKFGVGYDGQSVGTVRNSNIEVSTTRAAVLGVNAMPGATVFVYGTTIQNTSTGSPNGAGVAIAPGANVDIRQFEGPGGSPFVTTTISGFLYGVSVNPEAVVNLYGPGPSGFGDGVIIEENAVGIDVVGARANLSGRVKVRNNTGTAHALQAGIAVSQAGRLMVSGNGGEISGNASNGIVATHGSYVELQAGASITGNAKKGLVLATLTSGRINASPWGVATVSGNLGGDQVACDASSVLTGTSQLNLGGGSINCPNSDPGSVPLP